MTVATGSTRSGSLDALIVSVGQPDRRMHEWSPEHTSSSTPYFTRTSRLPAARRAAGKRVVRVKYGVDEDVCSGDHSCIRLSGCPTLTIKASSDPLRVDPVATVIDGCVGCGLCGENAHAASLCPSFYRGEVVERAHRRERVVSRLRAAVIGWLQR